MKITLVSQYHNTRITINMTLLEVLSPSQVARIKRKLCGMADCYCGGINAYPVDVTGNFILLHADDSGGEKSYFVGRRSQIPRLAEF
jgi:hypothetical protein